jgi:hypothetical protein
VVQFTLWKAPAAAEVTGETSHRVLHLSAPELDDLEEVGP